MSRRAPKVGALGILLAALGWLACAPASAQDRVELAPLEGDPADRVRGWLERGLADRFEVARVHADTPVAPWGVRVDGAVRARRRRLSVRLRVRTADGAERRVEGRFAAGPRGARRLARRLARGVEEAWAARAIAAPAEPAVAPSAAPIPEPPPSSPPALPSARSAVDAPPPRPDAARPPGRPPSVSVRAAFRLTRRRFAYRDDVFGELRGYELPAAPAVAVAARWYPLAHLGDGVGAAFGIDARAAHTLYAESALGNGADVFPTVAYEWQAGVRGRLRLGEHVLSAGFAFLEHAFVIEPSGPLRPGRDRDPGLPGVRYQALRPDLAARVELPIDLFAELEVGWRFVVDAGPIGDDAWFPRHFVNGVDGSLRLGWRWTRWLAVTLSGRYARYFYAMGSQVGDRHVAGGATDEYVDLELGLSIRDPGE